MYHNALYGFVLWTLVRDLSGIGIDVPYGASKVAKTL